MSVGMPVTARRAGSAALRAGAAIVAFLVLPALTVTAGAGCLYLLYRAGALAVGPSVARALPLEQLAGHAGQPLARVAVCWGAAGAAAGLAMEPIARTRALPVCGLYAAGLAVWLVGTGATSDALANNQRVVAHLADQLGSPAVELAWGVAVAAALAALLVTQAIRR